MGGTFDVLHRGHQALLDAAFAAGDEGVSIGVTTDAFANQRRARKVHPYAQRVEALKAFLAARGVLSRAEILPIGTPVGFALEPRFSAIAATEETVGTAEAINQERRARGLSELRIVLAPYVLADDARPIKSTRIRNGEVDREGHLTRPVRVAVGSENPVKVEATRLAAARLFGEADVRGFAVATGVPEQPFEHDTWKGALHRAREALVLWPEADFGVGIEAGLFRLEQGLMDVQACAVADRMGRVTYGHGPGFAHPPHVDEQVRAGRSVGDALGALSGEPDIGRKEGAVGWLSRGHVTRTALTEPAVLMAFLPRLRPELYGF
ncbi:MAG: inosine/xanthosine triphosphatase [Thermoplasmata archaeon]|jgi:inosine/xanthosine triphosphatase|nr:inosine/xanthosine triphosphatase [Thermoplasmata archaeon]